MVEKTDKKEEVLPEEEKNDVSEEQSEESLKPMSLKELLSKKFITIEIKEGTYRRGYSDGWIEAVNTMSEFEHLSSDELHELLFNHWQHALIDWQRNNLNKEVLPPYVKQSKEEE